MTYEGMFHEFQWEDRKSVAWNVGFFNHFTGFAGLAEGLDHGMGKVYVQTHDIPTRKQAMAYLQDVRVDGPIENRGLGSMLVREAIEECKRRGHKGICGHLSEVDRGHFSKLKHFYERLGFSVVFYGTTHPDYKFNRVGKIEMIFNDTGT